LLCFAFAFNQISRDNIVPALARGEWRLLIDKYFPFGAFLVVMDSVVVQSGIAFSSLPTTTPLQDAYRG
jgi:hypothetical protein